MPSSVPPSAAAPPVLRPLSRPTLAAYAAPALPGAMLLLPLYVHLPALYAGLPGLSLALVGSLLFAARLWDVATDPLAGLLSDRWPTRFGRRRPWLLAGLPLAMLAAWMLFRPGDAAGGWYLLGWTMLLYLGASLIQIPYYAWGAELSGDYDQRTRISGWREAAAVLGTVTAAALPAAFGADTRAGVAALGLVIVLLLPAGVLLAVWRVPDGTAAAPPRPGAAALRGLWRNGPFRRLLLAWLVNGIANGLPAGLVLLYVGHVMAAPDLAGLVLLLYFGAGIAAVPLWLRLARRYGKHRVWCGAMLWNCAVFVFVPLLGAGDAPLFLVISVLTGLCLGADLALPPAMQADVIDLDAARQRQDRAGLFFALWGMATKLALAAAIGIAFPLLDLAGFSPAGGNGPGALFVLAALYAWLPVAGKLVAVALVWRWPITRARQQRLRRLAARRRP